MGFEPKLTNYLRNISKDLGYEFEVLDKHSKYLVRINNGSKDLYTGAGYLCSYPINSATAYTISLDKAFTNIILEKKGIKTVGGEYFFISNKYSELRSSGREISDAIKYAEKINYPVFAKPNNGSRGDYASIIFNVNELIYHLDNMSRRYQIALIQKVFIGNEYRILYLDGEIKFAYKKNPPFIVGDGKKTINEYLNEINESRIKHGLNEISLTSGQVQKYLDENNINADSIIPKGEVFKFSSALNVSSGAYISDLKTQFGEEIENLCNQIAKTLNLKICGIDLVTNGGLNNLKDYEILEVNGNPSIYALEMIEKQELIYSTLEKVLNIYFNE